MSIDTYFDNIPIFPIFKQLTWDDKAFIESNIKNHEPYSDFNFLSIWGYSNSRCYWSYHDGVLITKLIDYEDQKEFISFIGINNVDILIPKLLDFSKKNNLPAELKLIPEICIQSLRDEACKLYNLIEDPDNHDYVLDLELISKMSGGYYASKRHELNRFHKAHTNVCLKKESLTNNSVEHHVRAIFQEWLDRRSDKDKWKNENNALDRVLKSAASNCYLYVLFIDGAPAGFTLIEVINNVYSMLHYWKTNNKSQHSYSYMLHNIAKDLVKEGLKYINIQQDIGQEELRQAKKRWHPINMLKKYKIAPKQI